MSAGGAMATMAMAASTGGREKVAGGVRVSLPSDDALHLIELGFRRALRGLTRRRRLEQ